MLKSHLLQEHLLNLIKNDIDFFIGPTISYGISGNGKFTYNVGLGIGYNLIK